MTNWVHKFRVAFHGIGFAITDQVSFWVHLPIAALVMGLAAWLHVEAWQWVAIFVAMTSVLVTELLNSAIELLVRGVHPNHHPLVGRALDISAGAVLVASLGAIAIGGTVLGPDLYAALMTSK